MLLRATVPAAVYAVILAVSLVPGQTLSGTPEWIGVAGHALGYALLGAALRWAFPATRTPGTLLIVVVLGLVNEFQQAFVPGRSAELFDVATDLLGALAGAAAVVAARR